MLDHTPKLTNQKIGVLQNTILTLSYKGEHEAACGECMQEIISALDSEPIDHNEVYERRGFAGVNELILEIDAVQLYQIQERFNKFATDAAQRASNRLGIVIKVSVMNNYIHELLRLVDDFRFIPRTVKTNDILQTESSILSFVVHYYFATHIDKRTRRPRESDVSKLYSMLTKKNLGNARKEISEKGLLDERLFAARVFDAHNPAAMRKACNEIVVMKLGAAQQLGYIWCSEMGI